MNNTRDNPKVPSEERTTPSDAEARAKLANAYRAPGTETTPVQSMKSRIGLFALVGAGYVALAFFLHSLGGAQAVLRAFMMIGISHLVVGLRSRWEGRSGKA